MKLFSPCLLFILLSPIVNAQQLEILNSGGGYFKNMEGSITFSIGEVIIKTMTQGDCCITQGFCQANVTVTAISEIEGLNYQLIAYPNPAKDFVILKINKDKLLNLKYLLYDMQGRLIKTEHIVSKETNIPFNFYIPSTYYFKIIDKQMEVKTFKIIKAN